MKVTHLISLICSAWLSMALPLAKASSGVTISEFMARNTRTLQDEDGKYSDWIELHNTTEAAVNLDGWFLTDITNNLRKWRIPATNLLANTYLVIFASGKDRAIAGAPLHTSFQLDGQGEYLALVQPDGTTIARDFAPAYPPQIDDISFGSVESLVTTQLIGTGATAHFLIPADGDLGAQWVDPSFDDATWSFGAIGLGFDTKPMSAGLFAYWPIDEGSGNATTNLVAGGAEGNIHGAEWVNDPKRGTVLSFANGAYVEAGSIPRMGQTSSNFTWSFWYQQSAVANGNGVVLGNREGGIQSPLQFIKFTPSNFEYYRDGDIGFIPYTIPTGSWRHLAVVKNAGQLAYYDNGVSVGNATANGDIEANPFYFGGDPNAPGEFAEGLIDDVSLWTTALDPNQITALAAGTSPLSLIGLAGEIRTDLKSAMFRVNASAYLRLPFTVSDTANFSRLKLLIKYNDGFVAYLNGVEVATRNAPTNPLWNSSATTAHSGLSAPQFEEIELSSFIGLLTEGANVLAIHGLNLTADDADFLISPQLEVSTVSSLGDRFMPVPTPGQPNDSGILGYVEPTIVDHTRGFYETNFNLALSSVTPGAIIRYTTNGTAPSELNGLVYSAPISISHTTTLRSAAFKPGYESSSVDCQTYIFLDDILAQTGAGFPGDWGGSPADYAMDQRVVTDPIYSTRIRDDLKSLPVVSIVLDAADFFGPPPRGIYSTPTSQGGDYERPCSAELFFPDGSRTGFQINCGLRIAGGASRNPGLTPKHGLRLLFKSQYGSSKLNYKFFDDSDVDSFESIQLRPNFNMSWVRTDNSGPLNNGNADGAERTHAIYVRDQFTKDTQRAMGSVGAHERFVHLYINGLYWGLYNPSEHTDAAFAASYYGGSKTNYDAIVSDLSAVSRPVDGDKIAWNTMLGLANQGLAESAAYAQIQKYLDVTNLADYMMLNFYCSTVDWPWQNWNAARLRETNAQFHFFVWDAEYTLETPPWVPVDRTDVGTASNETDSPARLYYQLRQNAEWRLLFADRVQKHLFNNGALTTNQTIPRFENLCAAIDRAIVGESARWGDVVRTAKPYTRDAEWLTEKNRLLTQFFPQRTALVLQQFRNAGLYPSLDPPTYSQHGGLFTNQIPLAISASRGTIYFTTDGSDPRLPGGAVGPSAIVYTAPILLTTSSHVRARTFFTNGWSALEDAIFVAATPPPLRITELMYHPTEPPPGSAQSADDFEFIELKNIGTTALALEGLQFTAGVTFTFPALTLLPEQLTVVVKNRAAFESRYGTNRLVAGEYIGTLSNSGERLRLEGLAGETIQEFTYSDWYPSTDGAGFSLVIADELAPLELWNEAAGWRPSSALLGSPGLDDPTGRPKLVVKSDSTGITISWSVPDAGYQLESTAQLPASNWSPVAGVLNHSVTLMPDSQNRFYRLRKL